VAAVTLACRISLIALVLGCALSAAGQTLAAPAPDVDRASSLPAGAPDSENSPEGTNSSDGGQSPSRTSPLKPRMTACIAPAWQIVSEVNGCMVVNTPANRSADSVTFAVGPRWTPCAARRFSPFAQVLFGGQRMTYEIVDPDKENHLLNAWSDGNGGTLHHFPMRSACSVEYQALGFNMTVGGGFDVAFGRAFAWRVVDLGYAHSWLPAVHGIDASQGVRLRSGLVPRIGTW
jgi:hypothetical protein